MGPRDFKLDYDRVAILKVSLHTDFLSGNASRPIQSFSDVSGKQTAIRSVNI